MTRVVISNIGDIPDTFGPLRRARKKDVVQIRDPAEPREVFDKSWGKLEGIPGLDVVIMSGDDPTGAPCKRDVFEKTYAETSRGSGVFRKTAYSRLVQIPKGVTVELKTLEGVLTAEHPDYIAVGVNDEVYVNAHPWVEEHLEFID